MSESFEIVMRYQGEWCSVETPPETLRRVFDKRQFILGLCGNLFDGIEETVKRKAQLDFPGTTK